jgi:hypothetical protein
MPGPLSGKTITVTTSKSLNTDEMAELVKTAFTKTTCLTCTSGGYFVLREETEVAIDPVSNARIAIS